MEFMSEAKDHHLETYWTSLKAPHIETKCLGISSLESARNRIFLDLTNWIKPRISPKLQWVTKRLFFLCPYDILPGHIPLDIHPSNLDIPPIPKTYPLLIYFGQTFAMNETCRLGT